MMLRGLGFRSMPVGRGMAMARSAGAVRNELWPDLRRSDFIDTVRRICTLCGWTGATSTTVKSMGVTSAVDDEGKSSVARAIAIAMANDQAENVLLIECDLLRPSLADDAGIDLTPGLSDVLAGDAELFEAVRPSGLPNLWLLPAGAPHGNPSRLLRSQEMISIMEETSGQYSYVVVDLPAVLKSSDAAVIAQLTDGVVLVVRADRTEQQSVRDAVHLLSGANFRGAIVNRTKPALPSIIRRMIGD